MRSQQTQWPSLSRAAWQLLILLPGQHPRQGQSFPSITSAMRHAPSQPRAQADVAFCGDGSQDAANPRCLALNHSMEHSPNPPQLPRLYQSCLFVVGYRIPLNPPHDHFPLRSSLPGTSACMRSRRHIHTQPRSDMHHVRAGDVDKQTAASPRSISMPSLSSRVHSQVRV